MIFSSCGNASKKSEKTILFEDSFDEDSQGEFVENVVQLPPPEGLGYKWKVLTGGYLPSNWILADEIEYPLPKKGFWVIPKDSSFLEQGGRSHNSVLYAKTPIPEGTTNFDISFIQYRGDNDRIMYVIGAKEPRWDAETEFGYMIQVPGTDSTTNDAYVSGILGDTLVQGMAFQHVWADHKIEVRGNKISWYINDNLMIEGETEQPTSGYFGIRQRYERGTRYDDVKIEIF